ncbi:MAG: helix-turn-helix transcriptional regulator [Candidatus Aminicenantes bacterium]|nr:helix-turn-helix transcriptional regulator [Candidatus Aminicenantes bacterium]
MKLSNILGYLGLIILAGVAAVWAAHLYRKYRFKYLLYLLVAILFSFCFGFLSVIGSYMALEALAGQATPAPALETMRLLFNLMAIPLATGASFAFILMVCDILRLRFTAAAKAAYFTVHGAAFVAYAYAANGFINASATETLVVAENIMLFFSFVMIGLPALMALLLVLRSDRIEDPKLRKTLLIFAGLFFAGFVARFALVNLLPVSRFTCFSHPLLEFLAPWPPLLVLGLFLERHYEVEVKPERPATARGLEELFERFSISPREREVVRLLLGGKGNRDIERELFISLKTVKTHVYNVYKKMGVKSRWQLARLVEAGAAEAAPAEASESRPTVH